jgi:hypothetical protein
MFFVKNFKLNRNSIAITENISTVFQLLLSLIVKFQFIKKVDFSEFRNFKNLIFLLLFVLISSIVVGQEIPSESIIRLSGQIIGSHDKKPLPFVTILNESTRRGTYSDTLGLFFIYAYPNDSIRITSIGFDTKKICLHDSLWRKDIFIEVVLKRKIYQLHEVDVKSLSWKQFKNQIVNMKVEKQGLDIESWVTNFTDPYYTAGVDAGRNNGGGGIGFSIPNKQDISHTKVKMFEKQESIDNIIDEKYNPKIVTRNTGLEGEDVIIFMRWCNFNRAWLLRSTEYNIIMEIRSRFDVFKHEK